MITKPFALGSPHTVKKFGSLKVYAEVGGFTVHGKIDDGEWFQLGEVRNKNETEFRFPANSRGYRCTLKITDNSNTSGFIFNGITFENCEALETHTYGN